MKQDRSRLTLYKQERTYIERTDQGIDTGDRHRSTSGPSLYNCQNAPGNLQMPVLVFSNLTYEDVISHSLQNIT